MMSRIPLIAAVVGALLVGGATTGVTHASWTGQRHLQAHQVSAGSMSFTATSPGAVTVDKVSGSTAETSFVLDDTSAGKNLQQRITATVAGAPAGVTATVGTSCTTTAASASVDTTPTSLDQTLCVKVASSPTAVSGTVTVSIAGAQQPTGWSTPVLTRTIPVTVNAAAVPAVPPLLGCLPRDGGNISFTWAPETGLSYTLYSASVNQDANYVSAGAVTPPHSVAPGQNTTTFYRVKATNPAGATSGFSNTVRVLRGNGASTITCTLVSP
jgi:hypothetical protein